MKSRLSWRVRFFVSFLTPRRSPKRPRPSCGTNREHLHKTNAAHPARGRGRSILLEITDKGRDGYLKAAGVVEQVDKSLTGGMTASERKGTLSGLRVIAEGRSSASPAR